MPLTSECDPRILEAGSRKGRRAIRILERQKRRTERVKGRQKRKTIRALDRAARPSTFFGLPWAEVDRIIAHVIAAEGVELKDVAADRVARLAWRAIDRATPGIDLSAAEGAAMLLIGPMVRAAIDEMIRFLEAKTAKAREGLIGEAEALLLLDEDELGDDEIESDG